MARTGAVSLSIGHRPLGSPGTSPSLSLSIASGRTAFCFMRAGGGPLLARGVVSSRQEPHVRGRFLDTTHVPLCTARCACAALHARGALRTRSPLPSRARRCTLDIARLHARRARAAREAPQRGRGAPSVNQVIHCSRCALACLQPRASPVSRLIVLGYRFPVFPIIDHSNYFHFPVKGKRFSSNLP